MVYSISERRRTSAASSVSREKDRLTGSVLFAVHRSFAEETPAGVASRPVRFAQVCGALEA